jgi:hypothetical protein
MRHPIGPLPSSIYWRRRVIVICLLAVIVALIVWVVTSGSSGNKKKAAHGPKGRQPAQSIEPSPGPSTGNPIDGRPGGRGTSGKTGGSGKSGGSGSSGSDDSDTGGSSGGTGTGSSGSSAGGVAVGSVNGGSSSTGGSVPVGSTLADCTASRVAMALHTSKTGYEPGEQPKFELTLTNTGSGTCKVDLGAKSTVLTITDQSDNHVWSSDDCPASQTPSLVQVPSDSKTKRTFTWNRKRSAPDCQEVKGSANAANGTYVVEISIPGIGSAPATFSLKS